MGAQAYLRTSEEKAFPLFSGFPKCSSHPPEKGEKGRFRPISRKGGQTPLKPQFVAPPFAAPQNSVLSGCGPGTLSVRNSLINLVRCRLVN